MTLMAITACLGLPGEAPLIIERVKYRLFGGSGLRVSELFLGTMTFGEEWGWGAPPEECRRMFDAYAEAGGNVIDTAVNYTDGASERIVGELLGSQRDHFVVSTKFTLSTDPDDPNASGSHRKNLARSLELSCDGSAPTASTCTGCTSGIRTRRSRRRCGPSTTRCAAARCSTSACPTPPRGSSLGPTRWPSGGAGARWWAFRPPTA